MSILDKTGEQPSITEGRRALSLFVDRTELLGSFFQRLSSIGEPDTLVFLHGEPGNGKSLLVKYLKENCCKRIDRKDWQQFDPNVPESVTHIIEVMSQAPEAVGHAYLDFASPASAYFNPLDPLSALLTIRKQLNDYCSIFPIFDFAWILYLKKAGRLTNEYIRQIFPSGPLRGLAAIMINTVTVSTWATLVDKVLDAVQKHAGLWWTMHSAQSQISRATLAELLSLDAETELIEQLPRLLAEDLSRARNILPAVQQLDKTVLLFDNHDAFWAGQLYLSEDLFHLRDAWLRNFIASLDLRHSVVIVTGQSPPKWSDATRAKIPSSYIDCWKVGDMAEIDARSYLFSAGITETGIQTKILDLASVGSGEAHPLYLGMCADAFLVSAQCANEPSESETSDPLAQPLADKGKAVVRRFLRYVSPDLASAVYSLAACRSFDQDVFHFLAEKLKFQGTATAFKQIVELSFVVNDSTRSGAYKLHPLVRRLVADLDINRSLEAHRLLSEYYAPKVANGNQQDAI
jgi:hypothetical protein